jgi:hypothetical protein
MSDVVELVTKPEIGLSPERLREIDERAQRDGRKIAGALSTAVDMVVNDRLAGQAAELAELRRRVEALERLIAPREVAGDGSG